MREALRQLPALNAALNFSCAVLLSAGYLCIRNRKVDWHRRCMVAAFVLSGVFLVSYVSYHALFGVVRFPGRGWIREVYFAIFPTHSILAAAIVPLALRTLYLAMRRRFDAHRRLARWTLPIWLYVSITGVIIYEMLY